MNTAMRDHNPFDPMGSMQKPALYSAAFHIALAIVMTIGIPFIQSDPVIISPPISVEIVEFDEITQTNVVAPPKKTEKPKEEPAPPKETELSPPEMKEEKPPEITPPKPPEIEETVKPPEETKPPEPEVKKPEPKPEPPKPKEKEVTKKEEPKQQDDFQSLLKNLAPDETAPSETKEVDKTKVESQSGQIAPLGERLTVREQDAIGQQLWPCWNIPAGAKMAENLIVEIRIFMNPDGNVRDTQVLDSGRYSSDPHFRAAADSAQRAVRNPRCMPLKFPPEKYNQLQTFIFRFDPRDVL
jgi:outer membrane biosynthesis protein TonB